VTERGFLDSPAPPAPPAAAPERGWVAGAPVLEGPVRHQPVAVVPPAEAPASPALAVGIVALLALIAAVGGLQLANFVAAQFTQAAWLGWLTLGLLAPALAALAWSVTRELRGFAALERVDGLRRDLAGEATATARSAAQRWLAAIGAAPETVRVAQAAPDAATIRALLRAGPLAQLDGATAEAGRTAALQVLAVVAVSPWPGLDGVMVVWRGLRLVRAVAELHGLRPGTLGTMRLFRRVALDAGTVMAADVAVTAITEALFASPLGAALAGQAAGSAISARRMLRLAFAVAQSCRPL
jgi:putative membrane protein